MDYSALIAQRRRRLGEIDDMMADATFFNNPKKAGEIVREHRRIKQTLELWERLETARRQLAENEELSKGDDAELAEIAKEEIPGLQAEIAKLADDIQYALLPADPNEDRDAIVEIRAGAGGDEASLFAAELLRPLSALFGRPRLEDRASLQQPFRSGRLQGSPPRVTGDEVFRTLKYESGVHRVQRVPATETQGGSILPR